MSWARWSCLWRRTCEVKTAERGRNSSFTTVINTSWYVCSTILFCKLLYLLNWIWWLLFYFYFQETYNSRLRERYGDDPLTHSEFDPDLWMEVRSSGGPDKNRVYGLSNTTTDNLRAARSVSTVRSSQSVSSTQSKEFVALQQYTTQLIEKYDHLSEEHAHLKAEHDQFREFVMNMASHYRDTCAPPSFWPYNN